MIKKVRRVSPLIAIYMACSFIPTVTLANTFPYEESGNIRVDTINVSLINPTQDQTLNQRIVDQIRKDIAIFPGEIVSAERLDFITTRVRNTLRLDSLSYDAETSMGGGLNLTLKARLNDKQSLTQKGYLIDKNKKTLPLLYDSNGKYLKAKLELLSMYYANNNAWYAQPGKMLNGNPLVDGNPAGDGYDDWLEAFFHAGLYGMYPLNSNTFTYGGLSTIGTLSIGQELFTDQTRNHFAVEDAYVGIVTGRTTTSGNRIVSNTSIGRQKFSLGDGLLIINTASNGSDRAALQSNARWASDLVFQSQLQYNKTKFEIFYLDPDELPVIDSETKIQGVNIQTNVFNVIDFGMSYLTVPHSTSTYYLPNGSSQTRDGLRVIDGRFRWQPSINGKPSWLFATEYAQQSHEDFKMRAQASSYELAYQWSDLTMSPSLGYRYASFSGDDPNTQQYERWDPLFSGGNGEQWVQGVNHFKIVQNSNLITHRVQLRFKPHPKVEVVPQFWLFRADSKLNLGGNPALSFIDSKDYGREFNVSAKYYYSRNLYVHGQLAYTQPGDAVKNALDDGVKDWWSSMLFVRYAF